MKISKANGKIKYFNISSIRGELVPFVVSLSNHEQKISSFDKLRTNGSSCWKMECFIFAVRLISLYFLLLISFLFRYSNARNNIHKVLRRRSRVFSSCGLTQKWDCRVDPRRFSFLAILFILLIFCGNGICERPKSRICEAEQR